jgi:hypothetical protein
MNTGVLNISDSNKIVSASAVSATININRAANGADGDVGYTGFGFQPNTLIAFSTIQGTAYSSWGSCASDLTTQGVWDDHATTADTYTGGTTFVRADQNANSASGQISSFDADGFTLSWSKVGTPTGTIQVKLIALRL